MASKGRQCGMKKNAQQIGLASKRVNLGSKFSALNNDNSRTHNKTIGKLITTETHLKNTNQQDSEC